MRDRTMPWSVRLAELCPVEGEPDPMRYDARWRAHVADLWRQIVGVPSVFEPCKEEG